MTSIRPKDEPAATATATGDVFLIDGPTGVRGLAKAAVPLLNVSGQYTVRQDLLGTDAFGGGYRFLRASGTVYTEVFQGSGGLGGTADSLNFYTSSLSNIGFSFGRDGTFATLAGILSIGPTAGVGYATGAGGAVTQATNKSTAVTLSKVCGAITLNNAALAAGTIVSFVATNTAIAATDVLVLNHISGGTPGSYSLNARCAAGSVTIDVRNNTGGSLSEAIVIQYALVKAVNS